MRVVVEVEVGREHPRGDLSIDPEEIQPEDRWVDIQVVIQKNDEMYDRAGLSHTFHDIFYRLWIFMAYSRCPHRCWIKADDMRI